MIMVLSSCSTHETVEQEAFGMIETFQVDKETGDKDGAFTKRMKDGTLVEDATYKDGELHGKRLIYFNNGNVEIEENYVDGVLQGQYRTYYDDGTVDIEGAYYDGVMKGSWNRYYPNGQLMEVVTFEENLENGPFTEYHSNGKVKAEGEYFKGDNEHGLLKLYDENGELLKTMECDSGICRTIWTRPDVEETRVNG